MYVGHHSHISDPGLFRLAAIQLHRTHTLICRLSRLTYVNSFLKNHAAFPEAEQTVSVDSQDGTISLLLWSTTAYTVSSANVRHEGDPTNRCSICTHGAAVKCNNNQIPNKMVKSTLVNSSGHMEMVVACLPSLNLSPYIQGAYRCKTHPKRLEKLKLCTADKITQSMVPSFVESIFMKRRAI